MNPAIQHHDVTVYQGDALDVLRSLPSGSVQCVVTSPPYYALRDYGVDGQLGLEPSPAEYVAAMVGVFRETRRVLADDGVLWLNIGDSYSGSWGNQGRTEERGKQRPINGPMIQPVHDGRYPEASRTGAIKPGAPPAKNLLGIPWRLAFALQDDGWTLRNDVIWWKPNAMPESVTDRLSTRYEHVFLLSKSRRYWFDIEAIKVPTTLRAPGNTVENRQRYGRSTGTDDGARRFGGNPGSTLLEIHETRNPGDVWNIPTSPFPGAHFACMPPELARRCVLAGCPETGTVLDPFTGSGTTAMVARQLGRRFVGAELNPNYIPIIEQRIGQEPFQFDEVTA